MEQTTSTTSGTDKEAEGTPAARRHAELMVFLTQIPFLFAHTLAKANKKWLQKRHRSKWWKRGRFPKVGGLYRCSAFAN